MNSLFLSKGFNFLTLGFGNVRKDRMKEFSIYCSYMKYFLIVSIYKYYTHTHTHIDIYIYIYIYIYTHRHTNIVAAKIFQTLVKLLSRTELNFFLTSIIRNWYTTSSGTPSLLSWKFQTTAEQRPVKHCRVV